MSGFDPEHGLNKKEKQKRRKAIRRSGKLIERYRRKLHKAKVI